MLFNHEDKLDSAFNGYGREKMGVLSRYEVTLERSLYKALHELQRLQAARDGQAVPLPEAIDVEVSVWRLDEADEMALNGETAPRELWQRLLCAAQFRLPNIARVSRC